MRTKEEIRAYDRKRNSLPHRVAARAEYNKTRRGKEAHNRATKADRERNPEKYKARTAIGNALRDGRLTRPERCESCNEVHPLHGHHDDYSKPLDVQWLCCGCHLILKGEYV